MAIRKLVSIKIAIDDALDSVNAKDSSMLYPVMMRWAQKAEKNIGSYSIYPIKCCTKTIENCRAEIPCNAVRLIPGLIIGEYECDECMTIFNSAEENNIQVFNYGNEVLYKSNNTSKFMRIDYSIADEHIIFNNSHNLNGQKVTFRVRSAAMDCDGFMLVPESHIDAIEAFLILKLAKRSKFLSSEYKISAQDMNSFEYDYHRKVRDARAMDHEMTESEYAALVETINNPFSGTGV